MIAMPLITIFITNIKALFNKNAFITIHYVMA